MKRVLMALMIMLVCFNAFAYEGFRFNNDRLPEKITYCYGSGKCGYKWLLQDRGYDISEMTPVVVDYDAFCLLGNMSDLKGNDWAIIETKEYLGVTTTNGYWREYYLYRK